MIVRMVSSSIAMRISLLCTFLAISLVVSEDSPTWQPTTTWWPTVTRYPTATRWPTRPPSPSPTASKSPTLSPISGAIKDKWPSLMHAIAQQTIERSKEQTKSPTLRPTPSPSSEPSISPTIDLPERLQFDYDPLSILGPQHWGKIDITRSKYFNVINDKTNHCDGKKQSPIDVTSKTQCMDDHTFGKTVGQTKFSEVKFEVASNALRGYFPDKALAPRANWSNLSGNIPVTWFDIKIMSEHWLFGQQYAGEFQLYFDFSDADDDGRFVILSIMLDDTNDVHNEPLELMIREWEEASWAHQNDCDRRFDPTIPKRPRTYFNVLSDEQIYNIWGIDKKNSDTRADFDIYRLVPTSWYCGYRGTLTAPPCTEKIHWRIMDLPIQISRNQFLRMQKMIVNRLDSNCQKVTAAFNGLVNRPLQSVRETVWCCNEENWQLREKDPQFWYSEWPMDYHGWRSYDQLIWNNTAIEFQH